MERARALEAAKVDLDGKLENLDEALQSQRERNLAQADEIRRAEAEPADKAAELAAATAVVEAAPESGSDSLDPIRLNIASKERDLNDLRAESERLNEELARTQQAIAEAQAQVAEAERAADAQMEKVRAAARKLLFIANDFAILISTFSSLVDCSGRGEASTAAGPRCSGCCCRLCKGC